MTEVAGSAPIRGWYHGWNVVAACILSQVAANGLTYNTYSLFLRDWSAQFNTPISRLQLPIFAMVLVAALVSPMVGGLADKYPARRLFGTGLLGMAIFYFAMSLATAAWQIVVLYGLEAMALVLSTSVAANALISRWFVRRLGLALGLSAFGIGMAGVLLPPLVGALLPTVGWRMIWRGGAFLVAFVVTPIVVWVIRDRPTEADGTYYLSAGGHPHRHHGHREGGDSLSWREVALRKNFWLLLGIYLPMLALFSGCAQNLAPYAASHGLSPSAGALLSVLSFSHVAAMLILGLLSDRFGNRLPFAGLAVIMVVGAAILGFGTGLPAFVVGSALIGFGGGLFTLLAAAIAIEFGAAGVGRAFGLCMLFLPITGLAPWAIAKIQETTGSYTPALMSLASLVVISGILSLLLRERRGGQWVEASAAR